MKKLVLIGLSFLAFEIKSQTLACDSSTIAQEGTYHISKKLVAQEATGSQKELLSDDILCQIEQKRKENETVICIIGGYEIVIYPKNQKQK